MLCFSLKSIIIIYLDVESVGQKLESDLVLESADELPLVPLMSGKGFMFNIYCFYPIFN